MPHLAGMEWDYADRLKHTIKSNGSAQDTYFTYDASGQRARKIYQHDGVTEERIYLGGYELYRRHAGSAITATPQEERQTLHVMDDRRRVAMIETKTRDRGPAVPTPVSRWRFQLDNHLGSAMLELDANGNVISYEEYHPYGTTAFHTADGNAEVSAKRYRYTGKEKDEETGLHYHGARYCAAWLGRWTASDPLGLIDPGKADLNLFAYVRGRPIVAIDPNGMQDSYPDPSQFSTFEDFAAAAPMVLTQEALMSRWSEVRGAMSPAPAPPPPRAAPPREQGPTIRAETDEEFNQRLAAKFANLDLPPDQLPPAAYESTFLPGAYTLAYGVKHTIYTPIKEWISPSPIYYLDSAGSVKEYTGPRDHSDAIVAFANLALLAAPGPKGLTATEAEGPFLFRGTTVGFEGSPSLQRIGITPTSTDPAVATIFASEAQTFGEGVVLFAPRASLPTVPGNVLAPLEAEVGVELLPAQFAERAQGVSVNTSRSALQSLGVEVPAAIRGKAQLDATLRSTPKMTEEQIAEYLKLIRAGSK